MLDVFKQRVPLDVEPSERAYPHLQVAASLVDLMMKPLSYVSEVHTLLKSSESPALRDQCQIDAIKACDYVLFNFCEDILSNNLTHQVYNYILPELRQRKDFPFLPVLSFLNKRTISESNRSLSINMNLLAGCLRLFPSNAGKSYIIHSGTRLKPDRYIKESYQITRHPIV